MKKWSWAKVKEKYLTDQQRKELAIIQAIEKANIIDLEVTRAIESIVSPNGSDFDKEKAMQLIDDISKALNLPPPVFPSTETVILTCGHPYTTSFPIESNSKAHCTECGKLVLMKVCDLPAGVKCGEEECERVRIDMVNSRV